DTKPEMAVRRIAHARGLRYRVDYPPLSEYPRRRADLVFIRPRVAVFIDGCFWHGCPVHYYRSKTNVDYWENKISSNRRRDSQTNALLAAADWTVLRFWEHESANEIVAEIMGTVRAIGNS